MAIAKRKKWLRSLIIAITIGIGLCQITSCSSVTVRPNGGAKDYSVPDYSQKLTYYFWSIQGEHSVDTTQVCHGKKATQMQTVATASDWITSALTLGIYVRKTANVWCEK